MTAIGGPLESLSLDGRIFPAAADGDVARGLGGDENSFEANGDRATGRLIKTITGWSLESAKVQIDDDRGDHEFLQALRNKNDFFPIVATYASGAAYQGRGQIVGPMPMASQSATAEFDLMGPGQLTKQG